MLLDLLLGDAVNLGCPRVVQIIKVFNVIVRRWPPRVPLAPNIDWDLMAKRFEMAGGYIKKAALRAALIAAEARRPITTADLVEAARQEYREMGRII